MRVLHSLHVPPYPDPYRSLTESPISSPTSQPPARSLTCMRSAFACHPPPYKSILVSVPSATDHCTIFPFFSLVSAVVVSLIRSGGGGGGGGGLYVVGWSLTLKKSRCQRRTTSSPSALPSWPRLALRRHFLYNHSFFVFVFW